MNEPKHESKLGYLYLHIYIYIWEPIYVCVCLAAPVCLYHLNRSVILHRLIRVHVSN